jgi:hypothetical protein
MITRALFRGLFVAGVLLVLPLQMLWQVRGGMFSLQAAALLALLVYSALRLSWLAFSGRAQPMAMTFWLFVYIWGALAPFFQTLIDRFPRPYRHDEQAAFMGAMIVWTGVLAYEAGRFLYPYFRHVRRHVNAMHFSVRAVLLLAFFSVLSTIVFGLALGGPEALLGSRGDINASLWVGREKSSALLMQSLLRGPPFIAVMALLYILIRHGRSLSLTNRRWLLGALLVVLPLNLLANFPPALQRFWFGTIVLTYLFALLRWRRSSVAVYIAVICIGLVYGFPVLNAFRHEGSLEKFSESVSAAWQAPTRALYRGDYDAYQMTLNSVIYVREQGPMMGKNIFDSVFFWFPRKYWPSKHIGSGHYVARYVNYRYTNLAAPLWMESYLAFGILGVVGILLLYGYVSAWLDDGFELNVSTGASNAVIVWVVALLAGYQIYLLRGDLLSGIAYLSCPLLILLLVARWNSHKQVSDDAVALSTVRVSGAVIPDMNSSRESP